MRHKENFYFNQFQSQNASELYNLNTPVQQPPPQGIEPKGLVPQAPALSDEETAKGPIPRHKKNRLESDKPPSSSEDSPKDDFNDSIPGNPFLGAISETGPLQNKNGLGGGGFGGGTLPEKPSSQESEVEREPTVESTPEVATYLSIPVEISPTGSHLTFSRLQGGTRLALRLWPHRWFQGLLRALWLVAFLGLGISLFVSRDRSGILLPSSLLTILLLGILFAPLGLSFLAGVALLVLALRFIWKRLSPPPAVNAPSASSANV